MSREAISLSVAPNGVEAVAVSHEAIDVYVTGKHEEVSVFRDGDAVGVVAPGATKLRDEGLEPGKFYTYTLAGVEEEPVVAAEQTFPAMPPESAYDVIVVGATGSGTAAAVTAARLGATVALIEETNRAGGMSSNGLSVADIRDKSRANGFFEEFRARVASYYGGGDGLTYEPRVANAILKGLVYAEPRVTFFRRSCVVGVLTEGGRVVGAKVTNIEDGRVGEMYARVIIDATAEADVAAASGVEFRIPREARSQEEPHAGHIFYDNSTDEILPGSTGKADHRIQSYAYLLIVKDYGEEADRTIPKPPGYNPEDYRYSPCWEETWAYLYGRLPNGKFEINQHPWGTDLPGVNYSYPAADPDKRREIAQLYKWRALGYLYYLQNELGMTSLGLADDEYPDNDNFPPELYVREAWRMVGRAEMDESDVSDARNRRVPDSIAIGDYPMDSHATRDVENPTARHRGEGEWWLVRHTPWYRVPLGVILPEDTPGLIVSTAVSATHVAYGTLRMEPVRMSLGQAAGTLAALAVRYGVFPDELPAPIVQDHLLRQKAYLTWFSDVNKRTRHFRAIQFLTVRGFFYGEEFRPDADLTKEEAKWLMEWMVRVEKYGQEVAGQTPPPLGGTPITRAEFAQLLVSAKIKIDPDWTPVDTSVSHYADLAPGTPESALVESLFRHRIDTRLWSGPPSRSDEGLLFHPYASIKRADAAQAIFLAHRPVAFRFRF